MELAVYWVLATTLFVTTSSEQQVTVAAAAADRDFELRLDAANKGVSLGVFVTDRLAIEGGFGFKYYTDYEWMEPDLGGEEFAIVTWEGGLQGFVSIGLLYDQPLAQALLLEDDQLSLNVGVRYRHGWLAKLEGADIFPTTGVAGSFDSVPVTVGATYTYWLVPFGGAVGEHVSKVTDLGLFARLEAGCAFTRYSLRQDAVSGAPARKLGPKPELTWNLAMGVVF